jgi:L-seryl-tRNA(Ser) seleniumtransferase
VTIYDDLGVPAVLNGEGPATRLGGLPLHPEVWAAMQEALASSVRIGDLERAAGARIAELLGVPAAYVTSGASAALHLATAAVMTRGDAALIDRLPDTAGMRHRVIIQSAQRDPYDRAVQAAGATLVPIGYPDSTHPGELERELGDDVAAVLFRPGRGGNLLSLEATCRVAHAAGVPVMIDGAMFVPPVDRLREYFDLGADLVAVSGGKGFRGPQGSGLLCGRAEFIDVIDLHHQDMDERDTTWPRNDETTPMTTPSHGVGRSMKVGR